MSRSFHWKEEAKIEWEKRAASWDERAVSMWDYGSRKDIIPFMERHIKKGTKLLDVGCGNGYGTRKLHRAGYVVEGIDISENMIQFAKHHDESDKIRFSTADINELPYENQLFDGMLIINVLEWTENPYRAMVEVKRTLKPGGHVCVGILGPTAGPRNHGFRRLYGEDVMINSMMPWEFFQLAKEMNFGLIDELYVAKQEVAKEDFSHLPKKLQQSLSFMWVFMLQRNEE